MRKRRKQKKLFGRMSIIYITMIIAVSAMGVGYAAWNDGLSMNVGITTGYIAPQIYIDQSEYEEFDYKLSNGNMTLYIERGVEQNSSEGISIKIEDNGSIPTKLIDGINSDPSNVSFVTLVNQGEGVFTLNINPLSDTDNNNIIEQNVATSNVQAETYDVQDEVSNIQNEIYQISSKISEIKSEINRLSDFRGEYYFKYNLRYEQGL